MIPESFPLQAKLSDFLLSSNKAEDYVAEMTRHRRVTIDFQTKTSPSIRMTRLAKFNEVKSKQMDHLIGKRASIKIERISVLSWIVLQRHQLSCVDSQSVQALQTFFLVKPGLVFTRVQFLQLFCLNLNCFHTAGGELRLLTEEVLVFERGKREYQLTSLFSPRL
jgi:hypothetical protein